MTFAQDTFTVFYQEKPYFTGNKVKVLTPKFRAFDKKSALYIVAIYQKVLASFTWGINCDENMIKDFKITLPTHKNAQIAFDFMESYIRELEAQRIRELEAYLFVAGLNDTTLTDAEIAALNAFEALTSHLKTPNGGTLPICHVECSETPLKHCHVERSETSLLQSARDFSFATQTQNDKNLAKNDKNSPHNENAFKYLTWQEFKIGDLFEIVSTKSLDENKLDFIENGINFVGRVNENNGVKGKIAKQKFEPNEPNTITATVIGNYKYAKLQREFYYCSQNINKLTPKFNFNKYVVYFFIAYIQKFISKYNGQQGGYTLGDINNHILKIPTHTKDGKTQIAFDFIENFIKAIEKQAISQVALYTSQKLNIAKDIVAKG